METQDYKDIRLLVGAEQAKDRVERDFGWDGIETSALKKLGRRVDMETDTDTLLRIAAVSNQGYPSDCASKRVTTRSSLGRGPRSAHPHETIHRET
jgi:hypothetical protein